jgi:hypothetical protein
MTINDRDVLELYWVHGCSSCLRMKEFVDKLGVLYRSKDVTAHPEYAERPESLGLRIPSAVLGDEGVAGIDLEGIARLIGVDYAAPAILSPGVLKIKYDEISAVVVELVDQVPEEDFDIRIEELGRTVRALMLHIVIIMRGFVAIEETNVFTDGWDFMPAYVGWHERLTGGTVSKEALIELAVISRTALDTWWQRVGFDDSFDRVVESKKKDQTSYWTLHTAFERAVWHTAQHTRQLQFILGEKFGLEPRVRLSGDVLLGLPLPDALYAED